MPPHCQHVVKWQWLVTVSLPLTSSDSNFKSTESIIPLKVPTLLNVPPHIPSDSVDIIIKAIHLLQFIFSDINKCIKLLPKSFYKENDAYRKSNNYVMARGNTALDFAVDESKALLRKRKERGEILAGKVTKTNMTGSFVLASFLALSTGQEQCEQQRQCIMSHGR